MSTQQLTNTVFCLLAFVLTSLAGLANGDNVNVSLAPADELDELPPVPSFTVPHVTTVEEEVQEQVKKADDKLSGEALEKLIKEAESGNGEAALELMNDAASKKLLKAALKWYSKAMDSDSEEVLLELARRAADRGDDAMREYCLQKAAKIAKGVKDDEETVEQKRLQLIKEAKSGNAEAALELAKDAEKNNYPDAAKRWFTMAAEAGSGEAWCELGMKAIDADDDDAAFASFQKSADLGYQDAKIYLAFGYIEGRGTQKDVEKGKALLLSVANSGNAIAKIKLAMAYNFGIGFEKDEKKAKEILLQLYQTEKDDSVLFEVAFYLMPYNEKDGIKRVDDLLDKFNESSNLTLRGKEGKAASLIASLLCHLRKKTDADKTIAQKRFSSLVDMLFDPQLNRLIYSERISERIIVTIIGVLPEGISLSDSEKQKLFSGIEQLAQKGNPDAMLGLAYLYLKGIGTEKNRSMFYYWLDKAARAGDPIAQFYAVFFSDKDNCIMRSINTEYVKQSQEKGVAQSGYLQAIAILTDDNNSPEALECKKQAAAEAEKFLNEHRQELMDMYQKNNSDKTSDDFDLRFSNRYSKWGTGTSSVEGKGFSRRSMSNQWRGQYTRNRPPEEDMGDLYDIDYYVNVGDLACAVARYYYQKERFEDPLDRAKIREKFMLAKELCSEPALNILVDDYWNADEDEKALELNKEALENGNPLAFLRQFQFICYNPDGTENFEQAFPYLQKAAEMNVDGANKYLGLCYVLGKGVKQDVEKGIKILEDNKEYSVLTAIYGKGLGVERDIVKSKRYYAMAYANGFKTGMFQGKQLDVCLDDCFNYEEKLIDEQEESFRNKYCLRRMEREGKPHAAIYLARLRPLDSSTISLCRKAAQSGDAYDMAVAGSALARSDDPKVKQEGVELLRKAAKSGQTMAMMFLAVKAGQESVDEKELKRKSELWGETVQLLKQAADKGNINACNFLIDVLMKEYGIGSEDTQRYIDRGVEINSAFAMILKASCISHNAESMPPEECIKKVTELENKAVDLGCQEAVIIQNYRNNQAEQQRASQDYVNAKDLKMNKYNESKSQGVSSLTGDYQWDAIRSNSSLPNSILNTSPPTGNNDSLKDCLPEPDFSKIRRSWGY